VRKIFLFKIFDDNNLRLFNSVENGQNVRLSTAKLFWKNNNG
jgi:hypothetical protein